MKKKYTEKYIIEHIEDRVFPNAIEEKETFTLEHIIAGSILKRNGADYRVDCVLDINEHGILLVFIEDISEDKDVFFHQFDFADIQGIKIKNKSFFRRVTLQFKDGRNYVFEFIKQNTSELPNQSEHLKSFISMLEEKNLHDMDNAIHKQNVKSNRKMTFSYIVTLIVLLATAMFFSLNVFPNSMVAMVIIIIGTGIIHFVIYLLAFVFIFTKKDRPFVKEFNPIMKEYRENENDEELLINLS